MPFFQHVVELALAKMMPAVGRNVRQPQQLLEPLREFCSILIDAEALPDGPMGNIRELSRALVDVEAEGDPTIVEDAQTALTNLGPEKVDPANILYPIASVTCFKGLTAILAEAAAARTKALTKGMVLKLAKDSLAKLDPFTSSTPASNEFRALLARATSHVNTVKPKHQDRAIYRELIGHLIDKTAQVLKQADEALASADGGALQLELPACLMLISGFFKDLNLTEAEFGPETESFKTWSNYGQGLQSRVELADNLAKIQDASMPIQDKVKVIADTRTLIVKCVVPLDETALTFVESIIADAKVDDAAKEEGAIVMKTFIEKAFGGEAVVVPAEGEVVAVLRWTHWSDTPTFSKECVQLAPQLSFFMLNSGDIKKHFSAKQLDPTEFAVATSKHARCIAELGSEAFYQRVDVLLKGTKHNTKNTVDSVSSLVRVVCGKVSEYIEVQIKGYRGDLDKVQKVICLTFWLPLLIHPQGAQGFVGLSSVFCLTYIVSVKPRHLFFKVMFACCLKLVAPSARRRLCQLLRRPTLTSSGPTQTSLHFSIPTLFTSA